MNLIDERCNIMDFFNAPSIWRSGNGPVFIRIRSGAGRANVEGFRIDPDIENMIKTPERECNVQLLIVNDDGEVPVFTC
ncbi:MAG: hypothetical protein JW939_09745 [Candidatus Thermoplasmatota archaeon]|nr:hypothetical protein [Candidatus Thermoplasmatota archaeon]